MKKLKIFCIGAAIMSSAMLFVSCEKEVIKEIEIQTEVQRISFERVALNNLGWENNFPNGLILNDVDLYNYSDDWSWSGFAVSNNTDKTTAGYGNQYSVFADGGAGGSAQFAIAYDGWYETAQYEKTTCKLPAGQAFRFKGLWLNNATVTALSIKNGDDYAKKFETGDWFKIIISGFNAAGNKTADVEFYLADFRSGKTFICQNWTFVDLSALGKVNKLLFSFASSDTGDFGVNTPKYACVDDITYYIE